MLLCNAAAPKGPAFSFLNYWSRVQFPTGPPTSAKITLRFRVQFPERPWWPGNVGPQVLLGHGCCQRSVQRAMFSDQNLFSDKGSNVVTNRSAT